MVELNEGGFLQGWSCPKRRGQKIL